MPLYKTPVGMVLFIHVPNAGGSSIEKHLRSAFPESWCNERPLPDVHIPAQNYHGKLLASLTKPEYSFMLVCHPADRIVTEWRWQSRKPKRFYRRLNFSWWLNYNLTAATKDPYYRDNHFRPQVEFKAFDAEVFKLEDGLRPVFRRLEDVTGLAPPTQNTGEKSDERAVNISYRDLVRQAEFYRYDFRQFGYHW